MRKLTIAIDCDDVLVPSTEQIIKLYNQSYNTQVSLADAHTSKSLDWQAERTEIAERVYEIQMTHEYASTKPYPEAVETCRRLSTSNRLILVTARPRKIMAITYAMLSKYFLNVFGEIEHVGLDGDKGEICHKFSADILIDDNYKHLMAAKNCGIKHLLWFGDYPWQASDENLLGALRCKDWVAAEREIKLIAKQ